MIIQLTGLSGVGKTTIALLAKQSLEKLGKSVEIIDGDEYRKHLCSDLGFTKEDRIENIRRLGEVAKKSTKDVVIISAISPYESARLSISNKIVHITCDLEILKKRDTKGLYKKALNGEINLTGINDPYEVPTSTFVIDTSLETAEESASKLVKYIYNNPVAFYIGRWQPFTIAHEWLISQKLSKGFSVLIGIRDILPDKSNPFTAAQVSEMIHLVYNGQDVRTIILPNIESVNYGRTVGYEINEFVPDKNTFDVSATSVRTNIDNDSWKQNVNPILHSYVENTLKQQKF